MVATKIQEMSFDEKVKLLPYEDKIYLCGYIDKALYAYQKKISNKTGMEKVGTEKIY